MTTGDKSDSGPNRQKTGSDLCLLTSTGGRYNIEYGREQVGEGRVIFYLHACKIT